MGAILDFVAAFTRDYEKYLSIEKEVRAICEEALRGVQFLWQSRVKAVDSLKKKLRDRSENYKGESENVADIVDLVAGRIILADWRDFERVEDIVKHEFNFKGRIQHPKPGQKAVNSESRFRGYGGRHFHVTRKNAADQHFCNLVIEIQVMTTYMWAYSTLAHDIEYKKLHGEPSEDLVLSLEVLKGIANLGEIGLDIFNRQFLPVARLFPQQSDIGPNLPSAVQTVGAAVWLDENDKQCIRDLRLTDPRHDKERIEASKDYLLEGSCSWVLEDPAFADWWTRKDSRLLWIHGDPGKGKTMMMLALISEVSKRLNERPGPNVLAYFFCENTSDDLNTTVSVLRGLIYLLVDQEKKLVRHIRRFYDGVGRKLFEGPNAMYALRVIFSDILKDQSFENVYLMIDALDECDPKIHELLDWIISEDSELSPKIKWLTTSRNVPIFTERLGRDHQLHTSLELNSQHVARAVARFIDYKVQELADLKSYAHKLRVFVRESLREKAEDTFLWVALVCKELSKVRQQKVKSLLEKIPSGLIPLYERMLDQVLHQEDENDIELSRRILCSVTLAMRPLHLEEIAVFAKIPDDEDEEDIEELVGLCGSFLTVRKDTVYLVHQSAKDYLSDVNRKEIFPMGQEPEHIDTACLCLEVMSTTLRKDICNLQTPGYRLSDVEQTSIGANIPFHAQYACLYWVHHLRQAGWTEQETLALGEYPQVFGFFRDHFLHWLEALSLMSKLSTAVLAINLLSSLPKSRMNTSLSSFVKDAERFILEFRSILETAPLQVYNSALVFSPNTSIIKRLFSYEMPIWIQRLPSVEKTWPASLQVLEGHSDWITAVAFSLDGRLLASASKDSIIRIWDTSTGALRGTLEDHWGYKPAMVFLSNGQLLASPFLKYLATSWDPRTEVLRGILESQFDSNDPFTFSPDGRYLACASVRNYAIRVWGTLIRTAESSLKGHLGEVTVMTFSPPHGQLLASGSDDNTVRLWESSTGASRGTLKGHSSSITAIVFSPPHGQLLASIAIDDYSIRLWDSSMGILKGVLEGHSDKIRSILFSPNGQLLVSTSDDQTIRLWDSATGASNGIIESNLGDVQTLSFSPDSRLLAVSSHNTVQLWNPVTGASHGTLEGHSGNVLTIQFSPNGHLLATGSWDETVRVWTTVTEVSRDKLEGHSESVGTIAVSPNGHLVASGSRDKLVRLWDSVTGASRCILEVLSYWVTAMIFSPDSQLLASGYFDGTVRLWDSATGASRLVLEGHEDAISALVFSPDGQILASGSDDATIILWDPVAGEFRGMVEGDSCSKAVLSLAFSRNGQILASAHEDLVIRLWDVDTCASQGTLEGLSERVGAMIFSPDSQLLACACENNTVEVWNIKKGTPIQQNELDHGGSFLSNQDGSQLEIGGTLFRIPWSLHDSGNDQELSAASYAIDAENEWVTYKGSKVLWLPHDRRPRVYMVHKKILVLGSQAGRVTFFRFMDTVAPPCT